MANVDYVIIGPGPGLANVLSTVNTAVDGVEIVDANRVHTADERAELTVWRRSWQPDTTVVEVYHGGDLADQRALSKRVYGHLLNNTDWDLTLQSDEGDDIVESRIKASA